jgi:hypothetical protein
MNICRPATIFIIISILGILLDIYLFGFYIFEFIKNIIFTTIIVFITNWICLKRGYSWISWIIVIINLLLLFSIIFLIKNKNTKFGKGIIEKEMQNRNKK